MKEYILQRKISEEIIKEFNISWNNNVIFFPYSSGKMYKEGAEPIKVVKGSRCSLYGISELVKQSEKVVITEGLWDCLSLQSIGIPAVTSTTGVMTTLKAINNCDILKGKKLFFLFDNDTAGLKALQKAWRYFEGNNDVSYCFFEEGEVGIKGDVNDYIVGGGDIKNILKRKKTWSEMKGYENFGVIFDKEEEEELKVYKRPLVLNNDISNKKDRAKEVCFDSLIKFNSQRKAICPFHKDNIASLYWYKNTNTVLCPVCDKTYDTIGFIMDTQKVTFLEALEILSPAPIIKVNQTVFSND